MGSRWGWRPGDHAFRGPAGALCFVGVSIPPETHSGLAWFANIVSIGIQVGGIGALAPSQRPTLARLGVKSMIAGTIACMLTACVAGMLV